MIGVKHRSKDVLLLSVCVAQIICYLVVQTASQCQAIQQERLPGPKSSDFKEMQM